MSKLLNFLYIFRWQVLIIFLVSLGVSASLGFILKNQVDELIVEKKEAERPANISLVVITTPDCSQCAQISQSLIDNLGKVNIAFVDQKELSFGTKDAQELIDRFEIGKVPALILDGEIKKNAQIAELLLSMGEERGESIVITGITPPYQIIDTKEIVGEFTLTYLTDEDCTECYDVDRHKNLLASFGMLPFEEGRIDKKDFRGRNLIWRYGITKTPTILLRGDLEPYTEFQEIWERVGRVDKNDNTYIFDAVDLLGTYRDLSQNKIVEVQQDRQQQSLQEVHNHVNFAVFINGEQFDFAQDPGRYFEIDKEVHLEESTLEGSAGKVIHVHAEDITMRSFLATLDWQLSDTCLMSDQGEEKCSKGTQTLKVFRNGEQDSSFGNLELQDGDQYLVTFGDESETVLERQIEQVPNFVF
jgi:hypothetical protein